MTTNTERGCVLIGGATTPRNRSRTNQLQLRIRLTILLFYTCIQCYYLSAMSIEFNKCVYWAFSFQMLLLEIWRRLIWCCCWHRLRQNMFRIFVLVNNHRFLSFLPSISFGLCVFVIMWPVSFLSDKTTSKR